VYHRSRSFLTMNRPSDPPPPETSGKPPTDTSGKSPTEPPAASLPQIATAVLWSFFGVRKGKAMQRDVVTIKPHQVIIVGILLAAGIVAALLILVRIITGGI
jgi:hypothetical protein